MQLLKVDDLATARAKIKACFASELEQSMTIKIEESRGYIVYKNVHSQISLPDFRRSTVDGYAVIAKETQTASETIPALLEVIEEVEIGKVPTKKLASGQCAYVPTGGMIPENADAMIMVEYSEEFSKNKIALYKGVSQGSHIVEIGEDLNKDEIIVARGQKIRGQEIGAFSACNIDEVEVFKPLKVAIISTGDELLGKDEEPSPAKVKDVNTPALAGLAEDLGMHIVYTKLVKDDEKAIRQALEEAQEQASLVLISGGSSKGKKDMTENLLDDITHNGVFTHGLALKPGKPTIIAWNKKSSTLFLGLPGHPVAAMMVFRLLIEWLQDEVYAKKRHYPLQACMQGNLAGAAGRETCVLVEIIENKDFDIQASIDNNEENNLKTVPYRAQAILGKSGLISTLSRAYGYIKIEKNTEGVKAGEKVLVYPV